MKTIKLAGLFLLGLVASIHAVETPKISFAGGVDYKTTCSEIDDTRACDSSNMINDRLGAAIKRNGGRRYNTIAISSNPIGSTFRVNVSTNGIVKKALLVSTWDRIYRSTSDVNPVLVLLSSGLAHNQHFSFVTMGGKVLMTGDKLTDNILSYDVANDTMGFLLKNDGSSTTVILQGKYHIQSKNYYIIANVKDTTLLPSTTYYASRIYYSLLAQPSSMTYARTIDIRTDDGEEITGIGEIFGRVLIFKPSSIHELSWTNQLNLTALGGDQQLTPMVYGFGCIAPRTLVNIGEFFVFLAKDGVRIYDGGRRSRQTASAESRVISQAVEPIITRMINAGTFKNAVGVFYAKKQQYILSYEDPTKFPVGRNNSALVYDIPTGEWFPYNGWRAESFATEDGVSDNGDLLYGQSDDGYINWADQSKNQNDPRDEIVLDTLDSTATSPTNVLWQRGTTNYIDVQEGTGSVKLILSSVLSHSSMTFMRAINTGEFSDKTPISKNDKFSFRVYPSSLGNISSIRMDLEINDITSNGDFDTNFTSVTIATAALINGNTQWSTVEIVISSFPILAEWTDLSIESFPFANSSSLFGIRFDVTGTLNGDASVSFDDLRIVKATERPLRAFRTTKQFGFGTVGDKQFRQVILNAERGADSNLAIDVFNNFGLLSRRIDIPASIGHELFVSGFGSTENVTKLDSVDFSVKDATQATDRSVLSVRPITTDSNFIYGGDQYNNQIVKIDKSSMAVIVSSVGSLGSGTSNFSLIYQLAVDDDFLYVCDLGNQRVKKYNKDTFEFVDMFGTLGQNTTSYHNPTGVAVDERFLYVGQDGNYRIQKLDKSTGGYVTSIVLNENTIGDITLHVDEQYLYDAYDILNSTAINYQDVFLEQRNKADLSLVNRIVIRPRDMVSISTYALMGDIGGSDQFIFISFTDNANQGPTSRYYIQKRLKSDFSLVREYSSPLRQFAVSFNGLAFNPKRADIIEDLNVVGAYLQLRYVDEGLDNTMKLYNQSFAIISNGFKEK